MSMKLTAIFSYYHFKVCRLYNNFSFSFLICTFSFFYMVNLARILIFNIFREPGLVLFNFSICFLFPISFISYFYYFFPSACFRIIFILLTLQNGGPIFLSCSTVGKSILIYHLPLYEPIFSYISR